MKRQAIHANCLIIGTRGLLVRGDAGSGKSFLCETLIETAQAKGNLGILVADDWVFASAEDSRLIVTAPDQISGKMEVRGFGLVETPYQRTARVHMLVELVPLNDIKRLPDRALAEKSLEGCQLPVLICPENDPEISIRLIRWGLRTLFPGMPDYI